MKNKVILLFCVVICLTCSCKKGWLEEKPDVSLVVPKSLTDLQALLDNTLQAFNRGGCFLGEVATDDYYLTNSGYSAVNALIRNSYTWEPKVYEGVEFVGDWNNGYTAVYYSNTILEALKNLDPLVESQRYNNVQGSALFYRAFAYYDMLQIFAPSYDPATATSDLGIVLRTAPILNDNPPRATLEESYAAVIRDLKTAAALLPVEPLYKTRPSKPGAYGMLARTYLAMRDYEHAYLYADSSLQLYNKLLNYASLSTTSTTPIPKFNDEIIFSSNTTSTTQLFSNANGIVVQELYNAYQAGDFRKRVFFKLNSSGLPARFGSYTGGTPVVLFNGIAVDEVYLIRSESGCRLGKVKEAISDLNILLKTRWDNSFVPIDIKEQITALDVILQERRKELCFRGLRWTDLKRLNKEERFKKTLIRTVNGKEYRLEPGDNRYVYPIPLSETNNNPNIIQNPR